MEIWERKGEDNCSFLKGPKEAVAEAITFVDFVILSFWLLAFVIPQAPFIQSEFVNRLEKTYLLQNPGSEIPISDHLLFIESLGYYWPEKLFYVCRVSIYDQKLQWFQSEDNEVPTKETD